MAEREGKGTSGLDEAGNSFAVFDNQWVTYDTPDTILEKVFEKSRNVYMNVMKIRTNVNRSFV